MKIVRIEMSALKAKVAGSHLTSTIDISSKESCIIRIFTDDGIFGIGDAQRPESPSAMCYFIKDVFAPLLLGRDPRDIEDLWDSMYKVLRARGRTKGFTIEALSAVDIALWDILGKSLDVPAYRLLGGSCNPTLRAYATEVMLGKPDSERLRDAEAYVEAGFGAFKVAVGINVGDDVAFIKQLRERFGYAVDIAVDANCGLTYNSALRFARSLERFEVMWMEEPIPPEFIDQYAELRRATSTPIAAGESEFTVFGFKDWVSRNALDIVQPDVGRAGGISQLKKISDMSGAHGLEFAPHCGHGSAVTYSATAHVAKSSKNFKIFEMEQLHNPLREHLVLRPMKTEGGRINVPDEPGLGIELDETFAKSCEVLTLNA
jgi:D-galactarolactone cycloisomerase